jgi:hypothetical protein
MGIVLGIEVTLPWLHGVPSSNKVGLTKHGTTWHGMTRHNLAWHGMARNNLAWHGMAWQDMLMHGFKIVRLG